MSYIYVVLAESPFIGTKLHGLNKDRHLVPIHYYLILWTGTCKLE